MNVPSSVLEFERDDGEGTSLTFSWGVNFEALVLSILFFHSRSSLMPSEKMSSGEPEFDIELVQPIDAEELKIPLKEPFTEAEEPCSKRCKPVSYRLFPIPPPPPR